MSETYQDLEEEARIKMDNDAQELYGYIFHYNYYRKLWAKIPRDRANAYFNGDYKDVVFMNSVNNLLGDDLVVDRDEMVGLSQFAFDVAQIVKENGNDQDAGREVRELISKDL